MAEIDSAPRLNAVSRDKKSASVRQANVPTNFNPISPRQKICSCTTNNRLWCVAAFKKELSVSLLSIVFLEVSRTVNHVEKQQ